MDFHLPTENLECTLVNKINSSDYTITSIATTSDAIYAAGNMIASPSYVFVIMFANQRPDETCNTNYGLYYGSCTKIITIGCHEACGGSCFEANNMAACISLSDAAKFSKVFYTARCITPGYAYD